jgi:hypothetical protein
MLKDEIKKKIKNKKNKKRYCSNEQYLMMRGIDI